MKKVLILGNPDDVILSRYVDAIQQVDEFQITVMTLKHEFSYKKYYEELGVKLIKTIPSLGRIANIPLISNIFRRAYYHLYLFPFLIWKRFDYIHVHTMAEFSLFLARNILGSSKLICTYWGSDLHRYPLRSNNALWCLDHAKHIVLPTIDMKTLFMELFDEKYHSKLTIVKFGVNGFQYIDQIKSNFTIKECKRKLGISPELITVAIGYNAYKEQQHMAVLQSIAGLSQEYRSRIAIVLQMTYGDKSGEYILSIRKELERLGCRYVILEEYLDNLDVACLRYATDIFIHAQISDALCATIQEYLYAGTTVLNPKWIRYTDLKQNDIIYHEYSDFSDLSIQMKHLLAGPLQRIVINAESLLKLSSWSEVAKDWAKLYS